MVDIVGQECYEFYHRWYHAALRELIAVKPVRGKSQDDSALLGKSPEPPIPATPLISTGDLNGDLNSSTDEQHTSLDGDNFLAAMLDLARWNILELTVNVASGDTLELDSLSLPERAGIHLHDWHARQHATPHRNRTGDFQPVPS